MNIYDEICQHKRLKVAYNYLEKRRRLDEHPYSKEEWLINLHNHLMYRSYKPHEDLTADSVVLRAIESALARNGIRQEQADHETQGIIEALTLA